MWPLMTSEVILYFIKNVTRSHGFFLVKYRRTNVLNKLAKQDFRIALIQSISYLTCWLLHSTRKRGDILGDSNPLIAIGGITELSRPGFSKTLVLV